MTERLDVFTSGDRFVVIADDGSAVEYLVRVDGTLGEYRVQSDEPPMCRCGHTRRSHLIRNACVGCTGPECG